MPFPNVSQILERFFLNFLVPVSQSLASSNVHRWLLLTIGWGRNVMDNVERLALLVKVSKEHAASLVRKGFLSLHLKLFHQASVRPNMPPVQLTDLDRAMNLDFHSTALARYWIYPMNASNRFVGSNELAQ